MEIGTMKRLAGVLGCLYAAIALGAGAHAQAATSTGKGTDVAPIEWSADMDCTASCHSMQAETMAGETAQGAQAHGKLPCTSCHVDEEGLIQGHAKVTVNDIKSPKRLKKSEVASETCLACHQATDGVVPSQAWAAEEGAGDSGSDVTDIKGEEATEKAGASAYSSSTTTNIDYLTDINGTTVNPHELPINKSHATIGCATCHALHDDAPLEETAAKACTKCHHDNVYECFTCHD